MVGGSVKHHSYKADLELFLLEQTACVKTKHTLHMKKAHHFLTLASGETTGFKFLNHTVV